MIKTTPHKIVILMGILLSPSVFATDINVEFTATVKATTCNITLTGNNVTNDGNNNYTLRIPGFAPIFPDICYHLTHYKPAAADIPVASDNPAHYADAIRYNARTPLQGSLLPLTRLVWA
ncbi:putative fimbrial protein [Escherichia coli]|nr:putative fimbrial protein [Escherichia coli]STF78897.1 putative fimbrial protein [Escherichia coli]